MNELTVAGLLTVAGNGAFVVLVLQLLKPWLKPGDAQAHPRYPALMNLAAVIVGLVGALTAQAVMSVQYEAMLQAVLVGLAGAAAGVSMHEVGSNAILAVRARHGSGAQETA